MSRSLNQRLLLALAPLLLVACASRTTPAWDKQFGQAVELSRTQQTLNPKASQNRDPVTGLDGKAANEAIQRYDKSFRSPEPAPNIFNIGVGGKQSD